MNGEEVARRTDVNPNADGIVPSQGPRLTYDPPKLPIDRGAMDPSRADNHGRTPLHYAGGLGRGGINEASGMRRCRA